MSVTLMCPNLLCRKILMVPDEMRGKRVRCSYCGNVLLVPGKGAKPLASRHAHADLVAAESPPEEENDK